MKVNIHLECFAMRKYLLIEKRKCPVLFFFKDIGEKCGS